MTAFVRPEDLLRAQVESDLDEEAMRVGLAGVAEYQRLLAYLAAGGEPHTLPANPTPLERL